ncbi:DoxX family protein [Chitinophaga barathri]|uniref:DoxX family protein n=1 Tax=Chitinophaga barathri TaxID=1647451 RepID=A0A3N4ME62_9BACT|nr:DoxX family protein [Chitinophaga barathri]RPD42204.1 DoxX family protein [Chitinophaga barathri]
MKLLSSKINNGTLNFALLLQRVVFGALVMMHGWPKLVNFSSKVQNFADPFGIGKTPSLCLVIFAEFFCGALVLIGLLTRLATIPLLICFAVIIFMIHAKDPVMDKETAIMFLGMWVSILLTGPGKYSLDAAIGK